MKQYNLTKQCVLLLLTVVFLISTTTSTCYSVTLSFQGLMRDGVDSVIGLQGVHFVAVSPEGNHVYTASADDDALAVFSRNNSTGSLAFVEAHFDDVNNVDGLNYASAVTVSPDGNHVYVAGTIDNAVVVFSRDNSTGALTFVEVQKNGVNGVAGLGAASSVAMSPDGEHLYVTGYNDDALVVFNRNNSTGALTFVEFHKDGVGGVDGLDCVYTVAVSPDGNHVYTGSFFDDAIAVFSRDSSTGSLTFVEFQKDGIGGVDGLDATNFITVSPDGNHVYAAGYGDNAVVTFSRNSSTGALTFIEFQKDGEDGVDGLEGTHSVTVSPDGNHVYATGHSENTLAVFSRDSSTGTLTFVEFLKDGINGIDGLEAANMVAVSPDSNHVYATGYFDDSVAVFLPSYTQSELNAATDIAVLEERQRWDANGDNKIGLEEAIQSLKVTVGN